MIDQRLFTNCVRSLFNIDGYQLPELTSEQQGQFVRDPVRYFIGTDKQQQDAIFREVAKRQPREVAAAESDLLEAMERLLEHPGTHHSNCIHWQTVGCDCEYSEVANAARAAIVKARGQ
jgi:hypothetical protein